MLQEMHFRNLQQKVLLLKRTEEAQRQLENTKLASVGGYVYCFLFFFCFDLICLYENLAGQFFELYLGERSRKDLFAFNFSKFANNERMIFVY